MKTLEKVSKIAGDFFAVWVIIFAFIGFLLPESMNWVHQEFHCSWGLLCLVWGQPLKLRILKGFWLNLKV